jgi:hypothetical protein
VPPARVMTAAINSCQSFSATARGSISLAYRSCFTPDEQEMIRRQTGSYATGWPFEPGVPSAGVMRDRLGVAGFQHWQKIGSFHIRNTLVPIGLPMAPRNCRRKKTGVAYERHHPPGASKKVRTALGGQIPSTGTCSASTSAGYERSGTASS